MRDFDAPAVRQVIRYTRSAESVAAYCGFNRSIRRAAAHHVPDNGTRHGLRPEFLPLANDGERCEDVANLLNVDQTTLTGLKHSSVKLTCCERSLERHENFSYAADAKAPDSIQVRCIELGRDGR